MKDDDAQRRADMQEAFDQLHGRPDDEAEQIVEAARRLAEAMTQLSEQIAGDRIRLLNRHQLRQFRNTLRKGVEVTETGLFEIDDAIIRRIEDRLAELEAEGEDPAD
jgi:hypothetical protein